MKNLIQKARNLFAKAVGQTVKPAEQEKPFNRIATDYTKYVYLNPGLNRSERNHLFARIKKNKHFRKGFGKKGDYDLAVATLKASPKNVPATPARVKSNSALKAAGEGIKVWTR